MKRFLICAIIVVILSAPVSAFQTFLDKHGIWLEDTEFSWIGLQKLYGTFVSGYDKEASNSSYLNLEFDPDVDTFKRVDDQYLPIEFAFRDDIGVKFTKLWVSWSAVDNKRPQMMFDGQLIGGFNTPLQSTSSKMIKRGYKYGNANYTWECFEVPFNLHYAQPATYKLTLLISALQPFKMRIDAIYLGDGTYEPQNRNRPLRSGIVVDNPEKVLPWVVPVGERFDRTMVAPLDKLAKNVNLTAVKDTRMPFVLAVTGGLDLGTVTLNIDNPLSNGLNTLKTEVSTVSFLKKRWTRNGSVDLKTEVAEYLRPGNQAVVTMGKTEFFWVDTIIPKDAKSGTYSTVIRLRTDNSSDYQIKVSLEVLDVTFKKPDNFLIFHHAPHYELARAGKLDKEQSWSRYKTDLADIVAHGISRICLPLICMPKPSYIVEADTFDKLLALAKDAGMAEVWVDISKTWDNCQADKTDGTKEFRDSIEKTTGLLAKRGFKPIYFIGSKIEELGSVQFNLIDELAKLPTKVETAATFANIGNFDPIDNQLFDFGDYDWKYVADQSPKVLWEPRPHWGQNGYSKTVSGVFNWTRNPETLAISTYSSVYGNEFDDFDQRLGDGSYTSGDLMMAYHTESYALMPSLAWECFRLGQYDWGLLNALSTDQSITSNFINKIPKLMSGRTTAMFCTPDWQDWFWGRGMEYIKWINGGSKVEPQISKHVIAFTLGSKTFKADGQPFQMTVEPAIISGRTYIPARYFIEPLGGDVGWEQATKTITLNALNHQIKLVVGNKKCTKDGKDIDMDDSPVIVSGRTLIPLRAASTLIDAGIEWDQATRTATITVLKSIKY